MKVAALLFVASAALLVNASPILKDDEEVPYQRFLHFTHEDGQIVTIDLEEAPDMELLQEIERNPGNNQYLLFTRRNPDSAQSLIINDAGSITNSNFNARQPTVVIVHGWLNNQNSGINSLITAAYLDKSDTNVIVLDWRRLAISGYVTAVSGVPAIGRGLGLFLEFLIRVTGADLNSIHLVGFSLGAHVVGNAGRELRGRVARITGLDPAGPLWNYNSDRLSSNDAIYVEAIHTDTSLAGYGIGTAIANADFYPNGGNSQPGCITNICDHNRAWELFAATVEHNHLIGKECSSDLQITLNNCRGSELPMGNDDLRKTGSGKYRVDTGRRYPF